MKVKNINPVEKHVEKGVLALCVLAAGYLGYRALTSPMEFTDDNGGGQVAVKEVENKITEQVDKMNKQRDRNADIAKNFVNPWNKPISANQDINLPADLLNQRYSVFVPVPKIGGGGGPVQEYSAEAKRIVPIPLPPEAPTVTAESGRYVVNKPNVFVASAGTGAAPAAGGPKEAPPEVKEVKALKVTAEYKIADALTHMKGDAVPEIKDDKGIDQSLRIDPELTKQVVYYQVEVQRTEVLPYQNDHWETIHPSKTERDLPDISAIDFTDDKKREAAIALVAERRGIILQPRFFPKTTLPVSKPKVPGVPAATKPAVPAGGAVGGGPGLPAPGGAAAGGGAPGTVVDTGIAAVPPVATITDDGTDGSTSIWTFDDDNVQPGHSYKYQMRVVILNPACQDPEQLADPTKFSAKTLESPWSKESAVMTVDANQYVYAWGNGLGGPLVGAFHILQDIEGKWATEDVDVSVGDIIGTQKDKPEFGTDYMVVDVRMTRNVVTSVVLMNVKDGKLVVRDIRTDKAEGEKKDKEIAPPPAATAPAAPAGN